MAHDAHRQSRGASAQSLEQVFKRLEELQMRQEACEARLVADESWQRNHEREVKDAFQALLLAQEAIEDSGERPVTADGASGEVAVSRPGRPKLRVIMGGLAVTVAAAFAPVATAAASHHHPAHHVTAAHSRRASRDLDPDGEMIDG